MRLFVAMRRRSLHRPLAVASHVLWAPQMAAHGGVQSYMWRLWEMLSASGCEEAWSVRGLSLGDSTEELAAWPNATIARPSGVCGSKVRFLHQAFCGFGRARLVTVGHVNQAPVAWFAKTLGLIDSYIVVLHGIEAWRRLNWAKRVSLKSANAVVVTTRFTAEKCAEANNLFTTNFKIIPLCAERTPLAPDAAFKLDGAWPILFVARLARSERYKGLEHVMYAAAALRREGVPIKLHVIGDGDDRPHLEASGRAIELDAGSLQFHGYVSPAILHAAYKSAKVFVMPSAKEGFGIAFLEAMRHGIPCVGGAHGGTPEIFQNGKEGLLVEYGRTEELVAVLRRMFANPDFASEIGAAGRRRFIADYTFNAFSAQWRDTLSIERRRIAA